VKARIAVVGLGKMALLHASILSALNSVELVSFCEISSLVRRFGKKVIPGVGIVAGVQELAGMGLDAVYVTTPPRSHFGIVREVYSAGIARHVFVEKPLASSYAEAQEMCRLAESHGGVNMVGYDRRFSVTFGKAKRILDDGTLGQLSSFEAYAYSSDFLGSRGRSKASTRGGVVSDLACHAVDIALWFFGRLEVKNARVQSLLGEGSEDAVDFQVASLASPEGWIRSSWCKEGYRMPEIGLIVKGSGGTMKVNEDKVELSLGNDAPLLWHKHDLSDNVPFFIGGTDYIREDEFFVRSILDGSPAEPSFLTASRVEEIIEQVKRMSDASK
jgi:UDP-N-acetylglucosamine 3-dehydrogenase